ncbi:AraC family transcriptional regulator [Litoreibacter meonggei]|uniref:AraC family transcriptional regulator n=1 Tax=Litoreibacter meonggei TaxID=1049199 RepID=A0A497WY61_9RHOB|nr:AraC family transcriptional regulator [Litoreibacter meonggei]RLJ59078.1 AraC family transcriptional regulator [Litoreibacter meonggei]
MSHEVPELLDLMRVRSTACIGEHLTYPWSVRMDEDTGTACFLLVLEGRSWLNVEGVTKDIQLFEGDIVLLPHGKAHTHSDKPEHGFNDEGLPHRDAHILSGHFQFSDTTPHAIISRLPDILVERSSDRHRAHKLDLLVQLINVELGKHSNPLPSALNHLTEVLCLHAMQNWMQQTITHDEALQALASPRIKEVIDCIHSEPAAAWSVESLAKVYGQSRTAFAAHFKFATGHSPINYVRQCRIRQACKMLEDTFLSVGEVAYNSGYADANAFNRAFRREVGASPGAYRRMPRA